MPEFRNSLVWWIASGALATIGLVACSSTTSTGGTSPTSTAPSGSTPIGPGGSTAAPTTLDSGPPPATTNDQQCAAVAGEGCFKCCADKHESGFEVLDNAWMACMCGAAGKCQAQCAQTDCSTNPNAPPAQPTDACGQCEQVNDPEQGNGACTAPITNACNGNADCAAYMACVDRCPG